jgi:hypothetical protein
MQPDIVYKRELLSYFMWVLDFEKKKKKPPGGDDNDDDDKFL